MYSVLLNLETSYIDGMWVVVAEFINELRILGTTSRPCGAGKMIACASLSTFDYNLATLFPLNMDAT
nr:hypothetical protein CFP56_55475 [Quercus suber]